MKKKRLDIKKAIKHPGKLTAEVGGKPSKNPGKVDRLAADGDKSALFYKNVLSKLKKRSG